MVYMREYRRGELIKETKLRGKDYDYLRKEVKKDQRSRRVEKRQAAKASSQTLLLIFSSSLDCSVQSDVLAGPNRSSLSVAHSKGGELVKEEQFLSQRIVRQNVAAGGWAWGVCCRPHVCLVSWMSKRQQGWWKHRLFGWRQSGC